MEMPWREIDALELALNATAPNPDANESHIGTGMAGAVARTTPRVLIVVRGGVVQEVDASEDMDIYIVDHDNLRDGGHAIDEARSPQAPDLITDVAQAVATELDEYDRNRAASADEADA